MRRYVFPACAVVAAVCSSVALTWTLTRTAHADSVNRSGPVAVVDVLRAITETKEFQDNDSVRLERVQGYEAEIQKLIDQLEGARAQLELIPESNVKAHRDATAAILRMDAQLSGNREVYARVINLELGDLFRDAHPKVLDVIARLGAEGGYQVVLGDDRFGGEIPPLPVDQVQQFLGTQRVFYAADAVDLTDAVINRLDAEYTAGR